MSKVIPINRVLCELCNKDKYLFPIKTFYINDKNQIVCSCCVGFNIRRKVCGCDYQICEDCPYLPKVLKDGYYCIE